MWLSCLALRKELVRRIRTILSGGSSSYSCLATISDSPGLSSQSMDELTNEKYSSRLLYPRAERGLHESNLL